MTIYKCDKCGQEVDGKILYPIKIPVDNMNEYRTELCGTCISNLIHWLKEKYPQYSKV